MHDCPLQFLRRGLSVHRPHGAPSRVPGKRRLSTEKVPTPLSPHGTLGTFSHIPLHPKPCFGAAGYPSPRGRHRAVNRRSRTGKGNASGDDPAVRGRRVEDLMGLPTLARAWTGPPTRSAASQERLEEPAPPSTPRATRSMARCAVDIRPVMVRSWSGHARRHLAEARAQAPPAFARARIRQWTLHHHPHV